METYDERIEDMKRRAEQRETMRYPEAFREDAVELVDDLRGEDWTQKRISEALQIPWVTLRRWREGGDTDDGQTAEGFRPVEVVDDDRGGEAIAVVSPDGWRIEGVSVGQAVEVLRRLG